MGRTIPSYRMIADEELLELEKFKKGLRLEDKAIIDEIIIDAKKHLHAASYASFIDPFKGALVGILIEMHKKIKRLEKKRDNDL